MLLNFTECPSVATNLLSPPPPLPIPLSCSHADALGGIMREGCAPCRPPATLGRVPPGRVCMADCIKHKQLYLIGLYPALITTNSQSLRTALFAPATLQDKQGKSHSSVILRTKNHKERDNGDAGTATAQMTLEHMQFTSSISTITTCNIC